MQYAQTFIKAVFLPCLLSCIINHVAGQQLAGGSFQLQNRATSLLLRPKDANNADGTQIVVYPKYDWQCLTWDLLPAGYPCIFTVRNYFTGKTFQPAAGIKENTPVLQAAIRDGATLQQWHFTKVGGGEYYRITMHGSDLVLTVEGTGTNAKVILKKWEQSPAQQWKLLPGRPHAR